MIICDWCHGRGTTYRLTVSVQTDGQACCKFAERFQLCETCQAFLLGGVKESCTPPHACADMRARLHGDELKKAADEQAARSK